MRGGVGEGFWDFVFCWGEGLCGVSMGDGWERGFWRGRGGLVEMRGDFWWEGGYGVKGGGVFWVGG